MSSKDTNDSVTFEFVPVFSRALVDAAGLVVVNAGGVA